MPDKQNVKEMTSTGSLSQKDIEFIMDLRHKISLDDSDRSNWKNKIMIANNQRLGVKRYTNSPYVGAPDIPLPETDKLIKKQVPLYVLSSWAMKKMCLVNIKPGILETPDYKEKKRKAEMAMNMLLRSQDFDWFNKLMLSADNGKHYGHAVFKTYEEFKSRWVHKVIDLEDYEQELINQLKGMSSEELTMFLADRYELDPEDDKEKETIKEIIKQFHSGEKVIEFDVEKISSLPQVDIINPSRIIVPAYTENINKASRICFEYYLTKEKLEELMDRGVFRTKDLEEIHPISMGGFGTDDTIEKQKARNEGVNDNSSSVDLYRIHEICCWKKDSKKSPAKRRVYTFLADVTDPEDSLLQDIKFPYEFEGWFYDKHDNEIKDTRYFSSRGTPEQIRALQEIQERCINNMIIRDEMNNTPIWEVLETSEIMDAHIRMAPGEKMPVKQLGMEVKQLNQFSKVDSSSERIMQILKAYTEEYQASTDQLFRNATNMGGGKTLGEVKLGMQQNSGPVNVDVISWNNTLSKVYTKVFLIMQERLGESIFINGEEITREDFNFPAEVVSNGSIEVADQELATQKAVTRLMTIANPAFADCVNSEDKYNALKDWLEKDGVKDPDQFCTDPKVIMQEQISQMQQQGIQLGQQVQQSQELLSKNQKDAQKAKRLESKHLNQAEANEEMITEGINNTIEKGANELLRLGAS